MPGKAGIFWLQNKYLGDKDGGATDQWISVSSDDEALYAKCNKQEDAMQVLLEPLGDMKFVLRNQTAGKEDRYVSFTTDGLWLKANYTRADAMPLKALPVQTKVFMCDDATCVLCTPTNEDTPMVNTKVDSNM